MRKLILTLAILTLTCLPQTSRGDSEVSLLLLWVDALGNQYSNVTVTQKAWRWEKVLETDKIESPAFRISITSQLPAYLKPVQVTADGAKIVEQPSAGKTQNMVVDLLKNRASLRFEFLDKKNNSVEMTLFIQAITTETMVLVKPECDDLDLSLRIEQSEAQHFFVGLNCIDQTDSIDIYFFRSSDSTWNPSPGLVKFDPENKFSSFKYNVKKPKSHVVFAGPLYRVGTLDENRKENIYSVFYSPMITPHLAYYSTMLGVSYFHYHEDVYNINLNETGITGKVNAGYRLIPQVLDVAMNMFATILPITHTSTAFSGTTDPVPAARFYGINTRLGYRLPIDLGATEFMFLSGFYWWGMFVPTSPAGRVYGLNMLYGPQLFIQMQNSQFNHPSYWIYFKFAPIANRLKFLSGSNYEIAIGGGLDLSSNPNPFSLTLDLANARFSSATNAMRLYSTTVGIQKAF